MGLSSNTLWHQTDIDGIKAILESTKLHCSYSLETIAIRGRTQPLLVAFPMISMADIPIADIESYIKQYGGYSIGFKRSFVYNQGFSPVWYRNQTSFSLVDSYDNFQKLLEKDFKQYDSIDKQIWAELAYTKNFQGNLEKYGFSSYRFYDEREWRWIPRFDELADKNLHPFIKGQTYKDFKSNNNPNLIDIHNISIDFKFEDIAYIIVNTSQAPRIKKILASKEGTKHITVIDHNHVFIDILGKKHNIKV